MSSSRAKGLIRLFFDTMYPELLTSLNRRINTKKQDFGQRTVQSDIRYEYHGDFPLNNGEEVTTTVTS